MSLWVYSTTATQMKLGAFSLSGIIPTATAYASSAKAQSESIPIAANVWSEVKWEGYTHTEEIVTQLGIYQASGSVVPTFYIDDIVIKASPTGTP